MRKCVAAVLAFLLAAAVPHAERPVVVVTRLAAAEGAQAAEALASAVTDALVLTLRLTDACDVLRADYLVPDLTLDRAELYYREVGSRKAVYGAVEALELGGYEFRVGIWSAESDAPVQEVTRSIAGALDAFDVADELALEVASAVVGRELAYGTIQLANTEWLKQYGVYVDRQLVGRNAPKWRVLSGERQVIVAKPGSLGDEAVKVFQVTIRPNETVELALEAPKEAGSGEGEAQAAVPAAVVPLGQGGTLKVTTTPPGARVLLDQRLLGQTPLELFGVPAGRYELRIERELFRPQTKLVEIQAGRVAESAAELEVDTGDPAVKGAMRTPWMASVGAVASFGVEALYYLLGLAVADGNYANEGFGFGPGGPPQSWLSVLDYGVGVLGLRAGYFVAGDVANGIVLSLAGTASRLVAALLQTLESTLGDVATIGRYSIVIGVPSITALIDIAFSPLAAAKQNERTLGTIRATGSLPRSARLVPRHLIVEAGGGSLARVGYQLSVVRDVLAIDAMAGVTAAGFLPFRVGPQLAARMTVYPLGAFSGPVRPSASFTATVESDFRSFGVSVGPCFGIDVKLPWLDVYTLESRASCNKGALS